MIERGEIFDPTPEYQQSLEVLFNGIFRSAQTLLEKDDLSYVYRHWRLEDVVYSAVETTRLSEDGVGRLVVFLARCQADESGLFQFRSYCYQEGKLQTLNDLVTADELQAYLANPELRGKHANQVGEEYAHGIHTSPDEEYVDFMVDLHTFAYATHVE